MNKGLEIEKREIADFSKTELNNSFAKIINLIENDKFKTVVVTDSKNHYLGFITPEQVIKVGQNISNVKKIMKKGSFLKKFNEEAIIKSFDDNNSLLIPIVNEKEALEYMVDIYSIMKILAFDLEFNNEELLENIPFTLAKNDSINHLLGELKKNYLENILILENGLINGVINQKSLIKIVNISDGSIPGERSSEKYKFNGIVSSLVEDQNEIVIDYSEKYSVVKLIEIMEKSICSSIYIKDKHNKPIGMIKLRKIIKLLLQKGKNSENKFKTSILSAPDSNIENIARKKINQLMNRHSNFFKGDSETEATIKFHKIENKSQKGMFKYEIDIRVSFGKGKDSVFSVITDDWGAEKSLNKAYSKISRLISDKRKITTHSFHKREIQE